MTEAPLIYWRQSTAAGHIVFVIEDEVSPFWRITRANSLRCLSPWCRLCPAASCPSASLLLSGAASHIPLSPPGEAGTSAPGIQNKKYTHYLFVSFIHFLFVENSLLLMKRFILFSSLFFNFETQSVFDALFSTWWQDSFEPWSASHCVSMPTSSRSNSGLFSQSLVPSLQ